MDEELSTSTAQVGTYLGRLGVAVITLGQAVEILAGQASEEDRQRVIGEVREVQAMIREAIEAFGESPR